MKSSLPALLLLFGFACSGSSDPENIAGTGGSGTGGLGTGGSPGGGSGGASATGGVGRGGAGGMSCAPAGTDPAPVATPAGTLPARFVLFIDPAMEDGSNVASWTDFTDDCGRNAIGAFNQKGYAAWGECVARHYVDRVNEAFAGLLATSSPLLQFDSFSVVAKPELARGKLRNDLPQAVEPHASPARLNVFLVMDFADGAGGVARLSQAYPDAYKGVSVTMEAGSPWQVLAHEFGHVMGFPHVSGPNVEATASYECCGGFSIATVERSCDETSNLMCQTSNGETSFDTCEHGAFLKKIARCWLGRQGGPNCGSDACVIGMPARVRCQNAAGGVTCTCVANGKTYPALDCNDAATQLSAVCNGAP